MVQNLRYIVYMGVSKNRGTPKWMVYNGKPEKKWMIWGYHYFQKHPYIVLLFAVFFETHPRWLAVS